MESTTQRLQHHLVRAEKFSNKLLLRHWWTLMTQCNDNNDVDYDKQKIVHSEPMVDFYYYCLIIEV